MIILILVLLYDFLLCNIITTFNYNVLILFDYLFFLSEMVVGKYKQYIMA